MQAKAAGSRHRDACQHGPCGAGNPIVQTPQNLLVGVSLTLIFHVWESSCLAPYGTRQLIIDQPITCM